MKHFLFLLTSIFLFTSIHLSAQVSAPVFKGETVFDPNFHIYLCFGQSNMEGNAAITAEDKIGVNERFKVMTVAADDYLHLGRSVGEWYTAIPPLCRWDNGLTPADYFGRTLTDSLPDSIKVGVIVVAMGGSGIDAFDKVNYRQYYQNADAWQKSLMNLYGGNPYAKIVEMAKLAQQAGVIKGILLHQGETNNGQADWPLKVKNIYYNLLDDLDLEANSIPLLAGEMLYQNQGGICWGMNSIIAGLSNHIPNSYVISSEGCAGTDDFHFTTKGARELGKRYGLQMLSLLKTYNTVDGQTVDRLDIGNKDITLLTGSGCKLPLSAIYLDGHSQDISYLANYTVSNSAIVEIENGIMTTLKDGESQITASFQGKMGEKKELTLKVTSSTFPLTAALFNPNIWENGTFDEKTHMLKTGQWGFGGWQYNGVDLSGYKYIVAKLGSKNSADVTFNIYDGNSYWGSPASFKFGNSNQVVVPLAQSKKNDNSMLNPEHIFIAGFWSNGSNPFVIDTVFLSNSGEFDPPVVFVHDLDKKEIGELEGFQYEAGFGPSVCQSIVISGNLLTNSITISAPSGFEISLDSMQTFLSKITLSPINGEVASTTVFVRMKAGLTKSPNTGNLSIVSSGAYTKTVTLSGIIVSKTAAEIHGLAGSTVTSTQYYSLTGQKLNAIAGIHGVFIVKQIMSDGTIQFSKINNLK
jgi:hypothetical protein